MEQIAFLSSGIGYEFRMKPSILIGVSMGEITCDKFNRGVLTLQTNGGQPPEFIHFLAPFMFALYGRPKAMTKKLSEFNILLSGVG